jgi:hypothetical protein
MPKRMRKMTCRCGTTPAGEDGVAYLLVGEKLTWMESSKEGKWWRGIFPVRRSGANRGRVSTGGERIPPTGISRTRASSRHLWLAQDGRKISPREREKSLARLERLNWARLVVHALLCFKNRGNQENGDAWTFKLRFLASAETGYHSTSNQTNRPFPYVSLQVNGLFLFL